MRDYRHHLFYSARIEGDRLFLDEAETHHATTVLRLAEGDLFLAANGDGTIYKCHYEPVGGRTLAGSIVGRETIPRHRSFLHAIVGMPERDAFEAILAGLTALGVARITPVVCASCQQAWWKGNAEKTSRRFHTKLIAAMKQSLYPYLPRLDPVMPFLQVGDLMNGFCIAADIKGVPFSEVIGTIRDRPPSFAAIVGPPGGFSSEESASLARRGVTAVRLSPARLTTELAAVTLCGAMLAATLTGAP